MAIIRSGLVEQPQIVMVLQAVISQLCLVAITPISWLSARPMHVVEHLTTLDFLMTDVPDLARVAVIAPIGNSDLSSLSAVISMAQAVPNLCASRKFFLN